MYLDFGWGNRYQVCHLHCFPHHITLWVFCLHNRCDTDCSRWNSIVPCVASDHKFCCIYLTPLICQDIISSIASKALVVISNLCTCQAVPLSFVIWSVTIPWKTYDPGSSICFEGLWIPFNFVRAARHRFCEHYEGHLCRFNRVSIGLSPPPVSWISAVSSVNAERNALAHSLLI